MGLSSRRGRWRGRRRAHGGGDATPEPAPGGRLQGQPEVGKDAGDGARIGDGRHQAQAPATVRARQDVEAEAAAQELGPGMKGRRWFACRDPTHVSILSRGEWLTMARRCGLHVQWVRGDGMWDPPYVPLLPVGFQACCSARRPACNSCCRCAARSFPTRSASA